MVVPFRTFAVFSLAFGMLAAGYLIAPAPGSTALPPPPMAPQAAAGPALKPVPTLLASRPPVPIVTPHRTSYFTTAVDQSSDKPTDQPTVDTGTNNGNPSDSAQAQTQTAALTADQPSGDNADARRAIEFDGYKSVRDVVKDADGGWHARAMRGRTEIAVKVDASGNVSAE
jgi:hypothetical protein